MLVRTFSKKIEFELVLDSKLATVNADPAQIDQILMNLAVNARDSMPNGGRLSIQTENVILDEGYCVTKPGVKPGDYVLMTVSDTGSGMDKETLGRIFEPFFTTKEVGKGTGLGLSVVYQIVRRHGGHIYCYSEPGLGTTYKIYLPAIPPKEEASEETTEATAP
jgi:two-component system, cell cycle sensor histidine kinase and response regulator CckA